MDQDEGERSRRGPAFARTLLLLLIRFEETRPLSTRSNRDGHPRLSSPMSLQLLQIRKCPEVSFDKQLRRLVCLIKRLTATRHLPPARHDVGMVVGKIEKKFTHREQCWALVEAKCHARRERSSIQSAMRKFRGSIEATFGRHNLQDRLSPRHSNRFDLFKNVSSLLEISTSSNQPFDTCLSFFRSH